MVPFCSVCRLIGTKVTWKNHYQVCVRNVGFEEESISWSPLVIGQEVDDEAAHVARIFIVKSQEEVIQKRALCRSHNVGLKRGQLFLDNFGVALHEGSEALLQGH